MAGLSGVGDTFGTCFGPLSRNRNLGVRLGRGERLKDILSEQDEVAEGVDTALALARQGGRAECADVLAAAAAGVAAVSAAAVAATALLVAMAGGGRRQPW